MTDRQVMEEKQNYAICLLIWEKENCSMIWEILSPQLEGKVYLQRRFLQYVFLQYVFLQKCNFATGIFAITKNTHCKITLSNPIIFQHGVSSKWRRIFMFKVENTYIFKISQSLISPATSMFIHCLFWSYTIVYV